MLTPSKMAIVVNDIVQLQLGDYNEADALQIGYDNVSLQSQIGDCNLIDVEQWL